MATLGLTNHEVVRPTAGSSLSPAMRDRLWGVYTMCFGGGVALAADIPVVFGLVIGVLIATLLYPFEEI